MGSESLMKNSINPPTAGNSTTECRVGFTLEGSQKQIDLRPEAWLPGGQQPGLGNGIVGHGAGRCTETPGLGGMEYQVGDRETANRCAGATWGTEGGRAGHLGQWPSLWGLLSADGGWGCIGLDTVTTHC